MWMAIEKQNRVANKNMNLEETSLIYEGDYEASSCNNNSFDQGFVVLQGRSIHKNLSKVAWFFVGKKGLRGQIWGKIVKNATSRKILFIYLISRVFLPRLF